jgi:hypothetical protein
MKAHEADARVVFFQQNHEECVRVRERVEVLLASEPEWPAVAALLEQFAARRLEPLLTPQQRKALGELAAQRKSREVLELLERSLARFEA